MTRGAAGADHVGARVRPATTSGWICRLGFFSLVFYVFTVPWENLTLVKGVGTVSKLAGLVAGGIALLGSLDGLRFRGNTFLWLSLLFVSWSWATYFWSISPEISLMKNITLLELWIVAWLISQYARTSAEVTWLLSAYLVGSVIDSASIIILYFRTGLQIRYSVGLFDPNVLACIMGVGVAVGWYVGRRARFYIQKLLAWGAAALATVAVFFTGSRGGLIVLGVGLVYAAATLWETKGLKKVGGVVLLGTAIVVALNVTPSHVLQRLGTIGQELYGGSLDQRTAIWGTGLMVEPAHPILGTGAATFPLTIAHAYGAQRAAHNVFLQVLVEAGLVGLTIFILVLFSSGVGAFRRGQTSDRLFWVVLLAQIVLAMATLNLESRKITWVLLPLIAVHGQQGYGVARDRSQQVWWPWGFGLRSSSRLKAKLH